MCDRESQIQTTRDLAIALIEDNVTGLVNRVMTKAIVAQGERWEANESDHRDVGLGTVIISACAGECWAIEYALGETGALTHLHSHAEVAAVFGVSCNTVRSSWARQDWFGRDDDGYGVAAIIAKLINDRRERPTSHQTGRVGR